MSKHTPEPWYAYQREHPVGYSFGICNSRPCGTLVDEDGSLHTDFPDWNPGTSELVARTYDSENAHANANRIVACVNACAGMDDPAAEISRLRARVAELEGAAKELADGWTNKHVINTDLDRRVVNMIMVWDRPRFEAAIAESARAANGEVSHG